MRVAFGQSTAPIAIGFAVSFSPPSPPPFFLSFSPTMETDEEWLRDFSLPTADCFYCLIPSPRRRRLLPSIRSIADSSYH